MKVKDKYGWLKSYAPPGIHLAQEVRYWMMTMVASTVWSMLFIVRYMENRSLLYKTVAGKKVLIEGALMPNFEYLTDNLFEVFSMVIIYCVIIAIYHYFYHYQGSKMMYFMKRLPNKWEVHIRCLSLPVCGSVIAIVYMLVLRMLYYAIYILCTVKRISLKSFLPCVRVQITF